MVLGSFHRSTKLKGELYKLDFGNSNALRKAANDPIRR